jgi:hypothetical protein
MSAEVMRRTTGSILPDTDVIVVPSQLILEIGAGRGSRRIDLGQFRARSEKMCGGASQRVVPANAGTHHPWPQK